VLILDTTLATTPSSRTSSGGAHRRSYTYAR
jgi:hypothetical protein